MADKKVIVTKGKIDALASSISNKFDESLPLTLAEMKTTIDNINIINYDAGTGLTLSNTTFNHSNSVTPKTAAAQSAKTLGWGDTFNIYEEKYDAQGHITDVTSSQMTMPSNPNTHYTTHLYAGTSTGSANAATTNGNTYLIIADDVTVNDRRKISGTGATTVASDASGNITINSDNTTYTFDGTYNASTNKAATVSTVTDAINALDGNLNSTTPGAAKTLTAFSQTNGKISATFGNISITKSQVSDFPTSMPASDVSSWAKATSKPTYTAEEVGAATDDHTHTINLASDTGTSTVNLTSGGKFKLTAGGSSVIFTMPSLSSSDITTALGFTPYNATNPNGYTTNTGTITGVTGSDGLTGSGTSGSVTIKHAAPTTSPATTTSAIYPITIDKYGHITAKGNAVTPLTASSTLDATKLSGTIPASCYTDTTYGAEKGISLSSGKFGHSNTAITAQNTQALYPIKIDAYGHITGYGTAVTSLPASDVSSWAKASTKPTYTASEVGAATENHTHTTSLVSDTETTGVVSLTSGGTFKLTAGGTSVLFKMPEANSDTQVTQRLYSGNYNLPLLMSLVANTVTTTDSTNISYRNNNIYANPSTGLLNSTKFQVDKKVILEYNSTTESLDFIFN